MANIELNIVALGDFSSVNAQIKALQAQIALLQQGLGNVALDSNLSKSINSATNSFSQALTATGQFKLSTVQASTELENFATSLQKGTLGLGNYFSIIANKNSLATQSVKDLALEQTKLQNSVVMADPTRQGFYSVFTPTKIDAIANATKIAANEQNIYNIAVNKGSQALINWGKNTQWAGRQLTVGMSVPLMLFGSQAVNAFNSVNKAITQLQKVYGEGLTPPSQNSIDQISQQVLQLGRNMASTLGLTQEFTVQVATSFAAMGKQGQDLINITEQTDRLAKLGNLDQQTATTAMIALQNVYKLSTTQTADAVNYFGAIQKQTSLSMNDLVSAESKVGPIIDQLGGSYKDTSIMLLAMKEAGVPAAQAANALKSAFASIIAPTSAATKEFASFGINLSAIKSAGGPVQMIQQLQASLQNLSPLVREQLIEKLFGKYQFSRISALIDNFGKVGSQTANAIKVAAATSDQLQTLANQEINQATQSPSAQWTKAMNTMKADLYPVGQKIVELGTKILDFGNGIAKLFSGLPGPLKGVMGALLVGVALAGPIIMLTGLLGNFIGYIMKGIFNIRQLGASGKTLGQLLTPELIAAQNANKLFNDNLVTSVDEVDLLTAAITQLTESLKGLVSTMNASAGLTSVTEAVTALDSVAVAEAAIPEAIRTIPFQAPGMGMATGGFVPGEGNSDTYPALLTPGEAVIPKAQAEKYGPFINAMITGKLPGYNKGNKVVLGHMAGNFSYQSPEGAAFLAEHPELQQLIGMGGEVDILSSLTRRIPHSVNTSLRDNSATYPQIEKGFADGGPLAWAESATKGGMQLSRLQDPKIQQAMDELDRAILARTKALNKAELGDQDLYKITQEVIQEQKKLGGASAELATALEKAASTTGGYRTRLPEDVRNQPGIDFVPSTTSTRNNYGSIRINDVAVGEYGGRTAGRTRGLSRNKYDVGDVSKEYIARLRSSSSPLEMSSSRVPLEQALANEINVASQSASPSKATKRAAQNMVDGVVQGVEQGKEKVQQAAYNNWIPQEESITNPAMAEEEATAGSSGGILGKAKGLLTKEGGGMSMAGKMTASMGLMTLGPVLANMLPKGSNVAGMASSASSMAGLGMMFGPWGGAAGAALGIVTSGFGDLMRAEKEHQQVVASTFSVSTSDIQMFGDKTVDVTKQMTSFDISSKAVGKTITTVVDPAISKYVATLKSLSSTDPTSIFIKNLSKLSSSAQIISQVQTKVAAAVAAGMDPNHAKAYAQSLMEAANQTHLFGQAWAKIGPSVSDQVNASETSFKALTDAINKDGDAVDPLFAGYKDLSQTQKSAADSLHSLFVAAGTGQLTFQQLQASLQGLRLSGMDKAVQGANLLEDAILKSGNQDEIANFKAIQKVFKDAGDQASLTAGQITAMMAAMNSGATDASVQAWAKTQKNLSGASLATMWVAYTKSPQMQKDMEASAKAVAAAQAAANKAAGLTSGSGSSLSGGTDIVSQLTKQYKTLLDDATKRMDAEDKTNQLMQKQNQAAKDALSYATQQTDVQNKIRQAMAGGDYLTANLLRQQMASNTDNYNMTSIQNNNQQIIDTGKQMIADAQSQIANGQSLSAAQVKALSQYQLTNTLGSYNVGTINTPAAVSFGSASQMGTSASATPAINIVINGTDLTQDQLQAAAQNAVVNALTTAGIKRGMSQTTSKVGG